MTRNERKLKAIDQEMARYSDEIQGIWKKAEEEDRETSPEERGEVEQRLKAIEVLKGDKAEVEQAIAVEQDVKKVGKSLGNADDVVQTDPRGPQVTYEPPPTLGEQFTKSAAYQSFFGPGGHVPSGDWKMDGVELSSKATLQSGGTVGGSGPFTQYVPGVVQLPEETPSVADLLPSGVATAPQIQFFSERVATNNAAGVQETAGKPESVLDFHADSQSLAKIATYLPVSDEMLEDAPMIQNYINQRLAMFVRTEEEQQILTGAGAASYEVEGFIGNYSLNGVGTASVTGTSGTAVFPDFLTIMNNQRGSSYLNPTALIMHPRGFGSILAFTDGNDQYYGGGPLSPGAYGGGRTLDSSRLTAGWSLWNVPIHVTSNINSGTMLLGNFSQGAQLWRKGGINVSASNSHSDFFKRNQTAIRAEERLALTIYRPQAFTVVRW